MQRQDQKNWWNIHNFCGRLPAASTHCLPRQEVLVLREGKFSLGRLLECSHIPQQWSSISRWSRIRQNVKTNVVWRPLTNWPWTHQLKSNRPTWCHPPFIIWWHGYLFCMSIQYQVNLNISGPLQTSSWEDSSVSWEQSPSTISHCYYKGRHQHLQMLLKYCLTLLRDL